MSNTDRTPLGDRMKSYEAPGTTRVAFKGQPLIVRLDGKSFHTFTKGLARPFDTRLSTLLSDLTIELVDRFGATVGYTQSDEITLAWYVTTGSTTEYPYAGRFSKMESLIAGYASAWFTKNLVGRILEKEHLIATFDARAFVVPALQEAYHAFLWRQQDCTKNAISMAAQSMFSHNSLMGLSGPMMQEKMWVEKGVNFNNYPPFFKRGMFFRREKVLKELSAAELEKIPVQHRPTGPVERSVVQPRDIWLTKQRDGVGVLFLGQDVTYADAPELPTCTGFQDPQGIRARFNQFKD